MAPGAQSQQRHRATTPSCAGRCQPTGSPEDGGSHIVCGLPSVQQIKTPKGPLTPLTATYQRKNKQTDFCSLRGRPELWREHKSNVFGSPRPRGLHKYSLMSSAPLREGHTIRNVPAVWVLQLPWKVNVVEEMDDGQTRLLIFTKCAKEPRSSSCLSLHLLRINR